MGGINKRTFRAAATVISLHQSNIKNSHKTTACDKNMESILKIILKHLHSGRFLAVDAKKLGENKAEGEKRVRLPFIDNVARCQTMARLLDRFIRPAKSRAGLNRLSSCSACFFSVEAQSWVTFPTAASPKPSAAPIQPSCIPLIDWAHYGNKCTEFKPIRFVGCLLILEVVHPWFFRLFNHRNTPSLHLMSTYNFSVLSSSPSFARLSPLPTGRSGLGRNGPLWYSYDQYNAQQYRLTLHRWG